MAQSRPKARLPRLVRIMIWRLQHGWRRVELVLARNFGLATHQERVFFLLVPLVGLIAGVVGFGVTLAIGAVQRLLWGNGRDIVSAADAAPAWVRIGAPIVGGLVVGFIIWRSRQPVSGHGISGIIEAVHVRQGNIAPRSTLLRLAAGIATVGSGGSLGREGPAIRTGAMLSSWLGQKLGLNAQRVRILVGCGAAAGMAAIYNTPVGAALFATEVILGSFALEVFGPLVVSSVLATVIGRTLIGHEPVYMAGGYHMATAWELLAYAGLGILGAFVSSAFLKGIRAGELMFEKSKLPLAVRPVLGMGLLGGLGFFVPEVYGNGFETITRAVHEIIDIEHLLILPFAKLLAAGITLGSGMSGGLFTPSLFFGAMAGGAYGYGVHWLFPAVTSSYGAYVVVGMAAIAAGTSHAPISAIMILFEMTGNYDLILPLMIASIISSLLSKKLTTHSMYLEPLHRRGLVLTRRSTEAAFSEFPVQSLVREDVELLRPSDSFRKVVEYFLNGRRQRLFVVTEDRRLLGEVSLHDIKHMLEDPVTLPGVVVHDLMQPAKLVVREADSLSRASEIFSKSDHERVPVLDAAGLFKGFLAKRDVLSMVAREMTSEQRLVTTFVAGNEPDAPQERIELPRDYVVRTITLPVFLSGRTLAEAELPRKYGIRIIDIRRPLSTGSVSDETELVIPNAASLLRAGDRLIVVGPKDNVATFAKAREDIEPGGATEKKAPDSVSGSGASEPSKKA